MSISLTHLLHGLFRRRKTLVASPESTSTPLGYVPYRVVDTHPSPVEGMKRARTREYAVKLRNRKGE